jgi:hypothetical protein
MRRKLITLLLVLAVVVIAAYAFVRVTLASDLVRATLEQQLGAYFQQPVRVGAAGASIFPRVSITLSDVAIGATPSVQIRDIRIATGLRGLLSRVVTDAEIVVSDARVALPLPFPLAPASAPASGATTSGGVVVQSVRVIELRDLVLTGGAHTLRVDMSSALDGDRLEIHELTARAARTSLRATGVVSSLAKMEAQLEARAETLDLDEVIGIAAAIGGPAPNATASAPAMPMRVNVKLTAAEGQLATFGFRDLSTSIALQPARLGLAPLGFATFGGRFAGRLDVDTARRTPRLRLAGTIDGADVAALMKAGGSPGGMTGRLGGTVALEGEGTDTATLIRTARGTMEAAVTDGTLPGLDLVRTIVLAFGKPSGAPPEGSGSAFSRLGGTFLMTDGALRSDRIAMASRDFDLAGRGSLQIASGAVDARTDVVLSEELTAQSGTDLRRYADQDGRVIVPAAIGGTLSRPSVSIDVAAAARRAVGNELKRRATSFLEGLFKKKN